MSYYQCKRCGDSHPLTAACPLLRSDLGVPTIRTSATYEARRGTLLDQFHGDKKRVARLLRNARRMGMVINPNSVYETGIANGCEDPRACVPPGEGTSYIKKRIPAGYTCEDLGVSTAAIEGPIPELALDIVEKIRRKLVAEEPKLARRDQRELKAEIIDKHGRKA